jgi:hypothetical protein
MIRLGVIPPSPATTAGGRERSRLFVARRKAPVISSSVRFVARIMFLA